MKPPTISHFLLDPRVEQRPGTQHLLRSCPTVPLTRLKAGQNPNEALKDLGLSPRKTIYHLTEPQGRHFKKCPGITEHYVCCNLHTLDQAENCSMACSYCFLQGYLTEKITTLYMNPEPLLAEIREAAAQNPRRLLRVGTGELSDSLALDPLTQFSRELVPFFASLPNAVLELKTKSDRVDNLLDLQHGGRTVVAWSVNPPKINEEEELGCAPLVERLAAARRVVDAGYPVAFHFDPMLHYEGCLKDYRQVVGQILEAVPADRIAWISVGSVRFNPDMRGNVMERYPASKVMLGEFVRGYDGKARYFKPIRHQLYGALLEALREQKKGAEVFTYFCMENAETWQRFMGHAPENNPHLDFLFAQSLHQRFPHLLAHTPRREDYLEDQCAVPSL